MTKKKKQSDKWMDDHDDAHFSDNPAVDKKIPHVKGKNFPKRKRKSHEFMTLKGYEAKQSANKTTKKKAATKKYKVTK